MIRLLDWRPMMGWRLGLAVCVTLGPVLTGCEGTFIRNLPPETTTECPEKWVGAWTVALVGREANSDGGYLVPKDCAVLAIDGDKETVFHPRFSGDIAFLSGDQAPLESGPQGTWLPVRWSREGDVLTLGIIDSAWAATLVVNDALDGSVTWTQGQEGERLVTLTTSAREIGKVLDDAKWTRIFVLERVGTDRRDLERALRRLRKAKWNLDE